MLNISKDVNGAQLVIALEGRLDTITSPVLESELNSSLDGVETLIFNLEKLQYISSAGLRVLLTAQKVMNRQGEMIVRNASEDVKEIFDVTGFSDILKKKKKKRTEAYAEMYLPLFYHVCSHSQSMYCESMQPFGHWDKPGSRC